MDVGVILAAVDHDNNVITAIIGAFWPLALIDLPLSLAVDTALVPVSALWWLGYYVFAEDPPENLETPPEPYNDELPGESEESAVETSASRLHRVQAILHIA